jgi:AcrR family transcriptional regulator
MSNGPEISRGQEIRDAAVALFYERGYNGTSMKDIAAAVTLAAPSLYNHLSSKQDLLRELMFDGIEEMDREFQSALDSTDDVVGQIRAAAEAHVMHHARRRRGAHVSTYEIPSLDEPARSVLLDRRRSYARAWQELIERGNREGACNAPSPKLAAFAILDMGIGVARWYRAGGDLSEHQLAAYYGDLALRVVGAMSVEASDPSSRMDDLDASSPEMAPSW